MPYLYKGPSMTRNDCVFTFLSLLIEYCLKQYIFESQLTYLSATCTGPSTFFRIFISKVGEDDMNVSRT